MAKNPLVSRPQSTSKGFSPVTSTNLVNQDDFPINKALITQEIVTGKINNLVYAKNFPSIQAAIDSLPATGGTVFINAGTYNISSPINITKSRTTLIGEGNSSIINLSNGANCDMITITGTDILYCQISNLYLYGNKANNSSGRGIAVLSSDTSDDNYHIIQNIIVSKCKESGIYTADDTNETWINNVRVGDCDGHGFHIVGSDNKLYNCVASHNQKSGIHLDIAGAWHSLYGCKSFGNCNASGDYGNFYFGGSGACLFSNCESQMSYRDGFFIEYTGANTKNSVNLIGCKSQDNGRHGTAGASNGVYINRERVQIIGGEYSELGSSSQDYGVYLDTACTNCAVIGAETHGNTVAQIYDASSGSNIILANQGYTLDLLKDHSLQVTGLTDSNLTASKPVFTDANKKLTSSGTVPISNGGTNATSFNTNCVPYFDGTSLTTDTDFTFSSNTLNVPIGTFNYGAATGCLILGADVNNTTITNNTRKLAAIKSKSYVNGRDIEIFNSDSVGSTTNNVSFGGRVGSSAYCATEIYFNTQVDSATTGAVNRLLIDRNGQFIFNEDGISTADIRMEGDTDANLFFSDASADKIGIGKNNPAYKLDVTGEVNSTAGYRINGTAGASGTFTTVDLKTVTVTNGIITSIV